jgi:hypothetical protein
VVRKAVGFEKKWCVGPQVSGVAVWEWLFLLQVFCIGGHVVIIYFISANAL